MNIKYIIHRYNYLRSSDFRWESTGTIMVIKSMAFGARLIEFESQLCHLLGFTSLGFHFLTCKPEIIVVKTS